MLRLAVLAAALLALALGYSCAGSSPQPLESSGIEGQVLLGPLCPVIREGSPCPDRPLQAVIDVFNPDRSKLVATVTSDEQGHFRVGLSPGNYYVVPQPPDRNKPLPRAAPQTVTVEQHKFLQVTIRYDTGIR